MLSTCSTETSVPTNVINPGRTATYSDLSSARKFTLFSDFSLLCESALPSRRDIMAAFYYMKECIWFLDIVLGSTYGHQLIH